MGTRRRDLLRYAGAASAAALLAACTDRKDADRKDGERPAIPTDRLAVELTDGLTVIDAGTGAMVVPAGPAVLTADGRRLFGSGSTGLVEREAGTGTVKATTRLRDKLVPRAVSSTGLFVALTPPGDYTRGRLRTTIVIATPSGGSYEWNLAGNLEPEAFSADGTLLYVLDYLPPAAPDRYRVRAIQVASGEVMPLLTRDKKVIPPGTEETMRGEGRQAVYDPAREQLFTLYTHQPDHQHTRDLLAGARTDKPDVHAFVHTLHLVQGWAYCVDLPAPFGEAAAAGHTIAYAGSRVLVTAAASGKVAVIDPDGLQVTQVADLPATAGTASSTLASDGTRVLVAAGRTVRSIGLFDLAPGPVWQLPAEARGLASRGSTVYVGQPDAIVALDAATGAERWRTTVPGLRTVIRSVS